jgi:hypothetical protein
MGKIHAKVDTYLDEKFYKTMITKRKDTIERNKAIGSREASFNNSSTFAYYGKEIMDKQMTLKDQKSQKFRSSQNSQIQTPLYNPKYKFDIGKFMNRNYMKLMRRSLCVNSKHISIKNALPLKAGSVSVSTKSVSDVKPKKIKNLPEKEVKLEVLKETQSV